MEPDSWILAGILAAGVLTAAFCAVAEMALATASRLQLRQALIGGRSRAQVGEILLREPARLLATLLVLKLIAFVAVGGATAVLAQRVAGGRAVGWSLLLAALVLLLSQLLPQAWAAGHQEALAVRLTPLVRLLALFLSPFTFPVLRLTRSSMAKDAALENIFLSEGGLRFLLNVGEEEAVIEDDEKKMIASIFEFGETLVREVMVPRIDIVAVPVDMPMLDALDVILKVGHSRIPVYADSVDNIVGILYAKDLLRYLRDNRTDVPLSKILRPAYFIPESKKVDELLQELQQRRVHMAVVVDEYGGTAGLVTIEDLLEEIVGEIQDEYDAEEPTCEALSDHEYLFDARISLDEVSKLLGVTLPTEGGDTLGGFIYSQLGKVPAVGDRIEFEGILIEVLSVAGRRIKQVRATVLPAEDTTSPEATESTG